MGLFAKLFDASSMFWQALDLHERVFVGWFGAYLCLLALGLCYRAWRSRLAAQLAAELLAEEPSAPNA